MTNTQLNMYTTTHICIQLPPLRLRLSVKSDPAFFPPQDGVLVLHATSVHLENGC